jgi:hypothetical protein
MPGGGGNGSDDPLNDQPGKPHDNEQFNLKKEKIMKYRWMFGLGIWVLMMACGFVEAQAQVSGSGTPGTIAKWRSSTALGDSSIKESGSNVAIGTTPASAFKLRVSGTSLAGIRGENTGSGSGLSGEGSSGNGVEGNSSLASGVRGSTSSTDVHQAGVFAISATTNALRAETFSNDASAAAVYGLSFGSAYAGRFAGNVSVSGTLSKGGGSFKIDHPLDPENKYLFHSFVESPDMMNIYNGNVTSDQNGEAIVTMPDYFEALNADFRYQLTVIGQFAQAIVGEKIKGNRFVIKTSAPNVEVSWQVTGVRQDAFAKKNRIQVEVEKEPSERGLFLHPEAFGLSEEKSIERARNPELMQQFKQQEEARRQKPQ